MTLLLIFAFATTFVRLEETLYPGMTLSSSLDGLNQVSHLTTPYIFTHLTNVPLPDTPFTGGKMTNI